jgi:hypothetical protein
MPTGKKRSTLGAVLRLISPQTDLRFKSERVLVMTSEVSIDTQPGKPRVLVFSLRNIFGKALFRCPHYEFDDIICDIDSATLLAPEVDSSSTRLPCSCSA